ADNYLLRSHEKVLALPFRDDVKRQNRDNAIDLYIGPEAADVLDNGRWEAIFTKKPEPFTESEKRAHLDTFHGLALGSDAFFPFGDNIERAARSGVTYVAEPGGSVRDDAVIEACNAHKMVMCFTGMRLFHH
ncbi:MAG: phosphoribosylaminoimidazolecarboxamide formyltransferase, partial [Butyrivibrio sp.]|nr:phosphoribosylaminoimidazolecarboxamide formyltransferase [Butyrivibrio sp.]